MRSNSVLSCRQPERNHLRLKTIYSKKTIIRSDFRNSEVGDFNLSVENVDFNSNVTSSNLHFLLQAYIFSSLGFGIRKELRRQEENRRLKISLQGILTQWFSLFLDTVFLSRLRGGRRKKLFN